MKRFIQTIVIAAVVVLAVCCSPKSCPTYAQAQDTISVYEKTGAVLFALFAIYCIEQQ